MLTLGSDGHWELPDGRLLYSGNVLEVRLCGRWLLGQVLYDRNLERYVIVLDGGTLLVTPQTEVRFPYDTLPKPELQDVADLWTVNEVASYLRLLPTTVQAMARRHELPSVRIGRVWRFRPRDILLWVDDHVKLPPSVLGDDMEQNRKGEK